MTSHYCSDYSNEICDKLKATQTYKKYSFSSYFVFSIFFYSNEHYFQSTFLHSKNTRTHRMHLFLVVVLLKKNTYCLCPSVRRPSVRLCQCLFVVTCFLIGRLIDRLVMGWVVHVRIA